MRLRKTLIAISLALLLQVQPTLAAPNDQAMAPSGKPEQALYWQGHELLKQGRWDEALARFRQLEEQLQQSEPQAADAALYWQAYALDRARRGAEARAVVDRLRSRYPGSRWLEEAGRLGAGGGDEESLVDAALHGLLSAPPEKALPLLKKVLEGAHPPRTKQRALFVLSQLDLPEAQALVLETARRGEAPLRDEAIKMLGISGGKAAMDALQSVYAEGDEMIRRAVLDAWMIADHLPGLEQAARDGAYPDLQRHAIHLLGALEADHLLEQLLDARGDDEMQKAVLQSLGVARNRPALVRFAGSDAPDALRIEALHSLGVANGGAELAQLYPTLPSANLRRAALEGLMVAGEGAALRGLYGSARNDDEKREILRMMTAMGDDEALKLIEQAIEEGAGQ
ncbi:HEAT repeat domain-containing protein [Pseudomarimonas salicorniae]|uniref:HEAT repeat domain-containing protein n=1 Tax=Pseudomarimonas salicorniae TaxID=2933270 RepID=A0ABT0GG89_9GAMM|nr:HEAT repeat domain-containing protein [Lysobacter sp. CAU 1642]MCK7593558.1 HEAT repeat domain-containing protein [Lysobacter sp. CAU 1642]